MTFTLIGRTILTAFFCLFVLFLYGPTLTIIILSLQGPNGPSLPNEWCIAALVHAVAGATARR
jgi:ABC-type spermidine/putrescine transport system permease subunit II